MPSDTQSLLLSALRRALIVVCIVMPGNVLGQSSVVPARWQIRPRPRATATVKLSRSSGPTSFPAALATAVSASNAWPSQPAYHALVASLAAQAGDASRAADALDRMAQLGARYPVERDPAFDPVRNAADIQAAVARMETATTPVIHSSVAATIGPADFFAEGVAVGLDGSIYIGSIRHGRILRWRPNGSTEDLVPATDSLWAVSGLAIAPDGQSLWATSNAIPQMAGFDSTMDGRSELVQLTLNGTGILARRPVGQDAGGAMLGDLLIGPSGEVYASDTRGQAIWRLVPGMLAPEVIARHPLIRSPQGMVMASDGSTLLVADYSHGLLRVDPATGAVVPLSVPAGMSVLSVDGLARHGPDLIAIQNGGVVPRVIRIRLDVTEHKVLGIEMLDRNLAVAEEPTLGVVVGDAFYYVANSQWEKRNEDGTPLPGAALVPTVILRVPLGRLSP